MDHTLFTNSSIGHKFKNEFKSKIKQSDELIIASGYFGASTLTEFEKDLVAIGNRGVCKILLGMIFHGGVTSKQQEVLSLVDIKLRKTNPENGIYLSLVPYHGKIYSFRNKGDKTNSLFLGSSNFSEDGFASRNECTALITDEKTKGEVSNYLTHLLNSKLSIPLDLAKLKIRGAESGYIRASKLLKDYEIPEKDFPDISKALGVCSIKLRVDVQSNSALNLCFDMGRINKRKIYKPRPWYEVEIGTSKLDRKNPFYPKSLANGTKSTSKSRLGSFTAYAEDDGIFYKFDMVVHSDDGKNISTSKKSGGRETLGRFIKGKLERAGVLNEGERITSEKLLDYGRASIDFIKISNTEYVMRF